MAVPTIASTAAAAEGTGTTLAVNYPSTVNSGDLLMLFYGSTGDNVPATPTDWAAGPTANIVASVVVAVFTKIADGTETGSLTLTGLDSGPPHQGRMFRSADADSIEGASTSVGESSKSIAPPDLTSTAVDRLGFAITSINDDETASSLTGETGGDFTLHSGDLTALGNDNSLSYQTASMATAATISGGTWTFGGANEDIANAVFAIFLDPGGAPDTDQLATLSDPDRTIGPVRAARLGGLLQ